jgi:hypothetical protein
VEKNQYLKRAKEIMYEKNILETEVHIMKWIILHEVNVYVLLRKISNLKFILAVVLTHSFYF